MNFKIDTSVLYAFAPHMTPNTTIAMSCALFLNRIKEAKQESWTIGTIRPYIHNLYHEALVIAACPELVDAPYFAAGMHNVIAYHAMNQADPVRQQVISLFESFMTHRKTNIAFAIDSLLEAVRRIPTCQSLLSITPANGIPEMPSQEWLKTPEWLRPPVQQPSWGTQQFVQQPFFTKPTATHQGWRPIYGPDRVDQSTWQADLEKQKAALFKQQSEFNQPVSAQELTHAVRGLSARVSTLVDRVDAQTQEIYALKAKLGMVPVKAKAVKKETTVKFVPKSAMSPSAEPVAVSAASLAKPKRVLTPRVKKAPKA